MDDPETCPDYYRDPSTSDAIAQTRAFLDAVAALQEGQGGSLWAAVQDVGTDTPDHRLISADAGTVAFRWKDYRIKRGAPLPGSALRSNVTRGRMKVMRLPTGEFIRRFLIHVLPTGFHRIRHAGFLANGIRRDRIKRIRRLLDSESVPEPVAEENPLTGADEEDPLRPCSKCGGAMRVIEAFLRGQTPKSRAPPWEEAA